MEYDELQNRLSSLLNSWMQMQYLLFSLSSRAKGSEYFGFGAYFDHEKKNVEIFIERLSKVMIDGENGIDFLDIKGIPSRGNKLIDLFQILKQQSDLNLNAIKDIISFINSDVAYKIACYDIVYAMAVSEKNRNDRIEKMINKLTKSVNNYALILTIDNNMKEEFKNV